jgi:CDP-glucose 4,6-dehydratase
VEGLGVSRFWRDRVVLVTGGTGLLGGWLVRHLRDAGAAPVCVVRDWVPNAELVRTGLLEQVTVVRGDIRDLPLLDRVVNEHEVDTVFHLAAQTVVGNANRNPIPTLEANVAGTWNVLEACRRNPTVRQIIVASSDKAYGACRDLPYTEDSPLQGRFPYDVSKSCSDLIAQSYAATFELPVAITRLGNLFGGGDLNWSRIVPGTIRSLLDGERPVIRSDGRFLRDYFYVEDAAAAYLLLAERLAADPSLRGRAFNFAYGSPLTVLDLVARITAAVGVDVEPDVRNETRHEIVEQYLDAGRARDDLGWTPACDFDEGLRRTVAWYREFLDGFRAQPGR